MRRATCGIVSVMILCGSMMGAQAMPASAAAVQSSSSVQAVPPANPEPRAPGPPQTLQCPGGFPTDLTVLNCEYTGQQRWVQFVTGSVTDQAMLTSILGAGFTQAIGTPNEWPRTWQYYGYRLGASYTSSLARGTAEFLVGEALHDDPRHIKCSEDASSLFRRVRMANGDFRCTGGQRFAHFLLDTVTVRKSSAGVILSPSRTLEQQRALDDISKRHVAWARLAGVVAGAVAQYPWEPHAENTVGAISQRAGISFGQTFLGSFFKEYGYIVVRPKKVKEDTF